MLKNTLSDKTGLRKGTWTPEEDEKLIAYVTRYGHWNWNLLPKFAGLERSGKSCRLRWLNYLKPDIKRGNYSKEEDETIIQLLQRLGNRWSTIAAQLPGRTDNEIKNYWHTNLKKRCQQNSNEYSKIQVSESKDETPVVKPDPNNINVQVPFQNFPPVSRLSDSCMTSSSNEFSTTTQNFDFVDAYQDSMSENFWLETYVFETWRDPCDTFVGEPHCFSPVHDVQLWCHDNNEFCDIEQQMMNNVDDEETLYK